MPRILPAPHAGRAPGSAAGGPPDALIAALAAEGASTIRGMCHLRRGYGGLLPELASLGAKLTIDQEMP
ncbi:hypothetical protein AMK19_25275 [Kitasatospora sp. CB01950]|nr:hypothetical protein AMK19_25275 [Kitasatospora sp. CB01950]